MEWTCPKCRTVLKGSKKAISQAKKAKCPDHKVKVVYVTRQ